MAIGRITPYSFGTFKRRIGNLISDASEGITHIEWTVGACPPWRGKIRSILKSAGNTVDYSYDASGNRISKTVTPTGGAAKTTWYVRDATGNVMAIYTVAGSDSLYQSEQHLYGSSRLGIFNRNINADAVPPQGISANLIGKYFVADFIRGNKNYELSNHLGNVLATVSDKKAGHSSDGATIDYYQAEVVSANDYYPFGPDSYREQMSGRRFSLANTNFVFFYLSLLNRRSRDNPKIRPIRQLTLYHLNRRLHLIYPYILAENCGINTGSFTEFCS